jgi:hypothetical protein
MDETTACRGSEFMESDHDSRADNAVSLVDAGAVLQALLKRDASLEGIIADLQAAADAGSRTALEKLRSPWGTSTAASRKAPAITRKLTELAATLPDELASTIGNVVLYLILLEQKRELDRQQRSGGAAAGDIHTAFAQRLAERNVTERHLSRISKEREDEVAEFIKECADAPRSSGAAILAALDKAGLLEQVRPSRAIALEDLKRLSEVSPKDIWDEEIRRSDCGGTEAEEVADISSIPPPVSSDLDDPISLIRFAPPRLPRGFDFKRDWIHPALWEAVGLGADHVPLDRQASDVEAERMWELELPPYGSIELLRQHEPTFDEALQEADEDVRELHYFRRDLIDRFSLDGDQLVEELRCDDRFGWAAPFLPNDIWLDHEAFRVWRDYAGLCSAAQRFNPMLGVVKTEPSAQSWAYLLRGRWKRFKKPGERLVRKTLFDFLVLPLLTVKPEGRRYLVPREIVQAESEQQS